MFGALPDHIIEDPSIPMSEKCVLLALARHADKSNTCYPSQRKIAKYLGSCRKTVNRALNSLARKGFITITARVREDDSTSSSLYTLNFNRFDGLSHPGGDVSHGGGEMSHPGGVESHGARRDVPGVVATCPTPGGEVSHHEHSSNHTKNHTTEQIEVFALTTPQPKTAPKKAVVGMSQVLPKTTPPRPSAVADNPPTIAEIQIYAAEYGEFNGIAISRVWAEKFANHYTERWVMKNGAPVTDWQRVARRWILGDADSNPLKAGAKNPRPYVAPPPSPERDPSLRDWQDDSGAFRELPTPVVEAYDNDAYNAYWDAKEAAEAQAKAMADEMWEQENAPMIPSRHQTHTEGD